MTEMDNSVGHYRHIREVAQEVCKEIGARADLYATVRSLCWLGLDGMTSYQGRDRASVRDPAGGLSRHLNLSLLSAAAHFNLTALMDRLLAEGHTPTSRGDVFPSAMQIAAMDGNAVMLQRLQEHLPELEELPGWSKWHGKTGPCSVVGAAIRGDMEILNLALYPPSRATPGSTDYAGERFGEIGESSPVAIALRGAQNKTTNPEVFDFIDSFFKAPLSVGDLYNSLAWYSRAGSVNMVRHLLDKGVPVQRPFRYPEVLDPPLVEACKGAHDDIVGLLLERGADPNYYGAGDMRPHTALPMAASSGCLSIVCKLLNHGALINELNPNIEDLPAFWYAVAIEHTKMLELLLARGTRFDAWGEVALEMSLDLGLDSTVDILHEHGVKVDSPITNSGYAPWKRWPMLITGFNIEEVVKTGT